MLYFQSLDGDYETLHLAPCSPESAEFSLPTDSLESAREFLNREDGLYRMHHADAGTPCFIEFIPGLSWDDIPEGELNNYSFYEVGQIQVWKSLAELNADSGE